MIVLIICTLRSPKLYLQGLYPRPNLHQDGDDLVLEVWAAWQTSMLATAPHKKASSTHNFIQPFLVTETIEVNYTAPQRLSFEGEISPGGTDLRGVAECL